ncbi:MAG: protease inhibitor I42 family protein [Alphaproteobacteria bacterium]
MTLLEAGRRSWPAMALGLGLALAPLAGAAASPEGRRASVLTEDWRGIVLGQAGVPIEIRLRSQPGTGYSWVVTRSANLVTPMKPLKGARSLPGGWQVQRFRFLAMRAGTYRVAFSYDQPWRGGAKGAKVKNYLIMVR